LHLHILWMFHSKKAAKKIVSSTPLVPVVKTVSPTSAPGDIAFAGRQLRSDKSKHHYLLANRKRASSVPSTARAVINTFAPLTSTAITLPAAPLHPVLPPIDIVVAADNSDDDMAESNFGPVLFTGAHDQDARTWLNTLSDYIDYKGVEDDKTLALFKLRLTGHARDWLVTVPDNQKDTFVHLSTAFLARFQPKELEKYKFAKDLFNVRQEPFESVDEFITKLRKKASLVGLDAQLQIFAALNGLLPTIASYVMEHNPNTLDEILQHARVAEITRHPSTHPSDDRVSGQLDKITEELGRLSVRLNSMSTANVSARPPSSSPGRRQVSFQEQRPRSPSPYRRPEASYRPEQRPVSDNYRQSRPEFTDRLPQAYDQRSNYQPRPRQVQDRPQSSRPTMRGPDYVSGPRACNRCGRSGGHLNTQCPALGQDCFHCGRRGHSYRVCRSAGQSSQQY
jgi:hypothetical protein